MTRMRVVSETVVLVVIGQGLEVMVFVLYNFERLYRALDRVWRRRFASIYR